MKSLDLRLELRKAVNELWSNLAQLEKAIENGNRSRQAVASATGRLKSGIMEKWKQEVEADKLTVQQLSQSAPVVENSYDGLNFKDLESMLVEVHRLQIQADELRKKYGVALRADDEERKYLKENARSLLDKVIRPPRGQ